MTEAGGALDVVATVDLAGICRGRAAPAGTADSVGWVPANLGITGFGALADNPFGSLGDLRLWPDRTTTVPLPTRGAPIRLSLGELRTPDGSEWECCTRTILRHVLAELRNSFGLMLRASFEQEFILKSRDEPRHPFSVEALLAGEPYGTELVAALTHAGLEPETWLPEFGNHQWEITLKPAEALLAADRAITLREIVRGLAIVSGTEVTFTPTPPACAVTSGVHIHFSLWTADGQPATHGSGGSVLSARANSFAAGILEHASALLALTAPSVVSYDRLRPGHWSADGARLGMQDREALLRVPGAVSPVADISSQVHFEYRGSDGTANPWLALTALVRAGLDGLRRTLPLPQPGGATVWPLPSRLADALLALEGDKSISGSLPADLLSTYLSAKRSEIREMSDLAPEDVQTRYANSY